MSMRTATVPALLAVVCWVASVTSRAQSYVVEVPAEEMRGTGLLHTHVVEGGRIWDPRTIWSPVHVTLNCSVPGFSVLTASSVDKLPAASKVLWCGWRHILNQPNVCELRFSMLRDSCFAVKPPQAGFLSLGQPDLECSVTTKEDVFADLMRGAIITALAIELFLNAERLSRSQAFRLTSGGFMGVTLVALIACVFLFRTAPAKKYLAGSFVLSAGATWAFVKWCLQKSIPGMFELLLTPVGVWYVIITATAGVGVTYWIDNPDHYKLHTSIRVGLQMVSLVLVYSSIADQGLAIAAVLLLIAYGGLHGFFRYLSTAVMTVVRLVTRLVNWVRRKLGWPQPRNRGLPEFSGLPDDYVEDEEYDSSQDSDFDPDTTDSGEGEQDDSAPGPEDEGEQADVYPPETHRQRAPTAAAAGAPGAPQPQLSTGSSWSWPWQAWGRAAPAAGPAAAGVGRGADDELAAAPSFDQWHRAQPHTAQAAAQASLAGVRAAGDAGAGRAPGPSPGGWDAPMLAVNRAQGTNYQQQPAVVQRPDSGSPWSERKVMDFTQPKPVSPPAAAATAGASTTPKTGSRKVVNPETLREITINGSTFRELLARGFVHDVTNNTLVPPPAGQASPVPVVNVRGAPTPSSNLRSRRPGAAV